MATRARAKRQQHKAPMLRRTTVHILQIGLQQDQQLGITRTQQCHRHDALRADAQLAICAQVDFTVAPQANGAHVDGPHHGAPATYLGALLGDLGPAVLQHTQVGGGATHVRQDETVQATEPLRSHQAGRRPGQHRLDRARGNAFRQRQRAVPLDDHQWAADLQLRHGAVHGIDQRRYT